MCETKDRFLGIQAVEDRVNRKKSTIYAWMKAKRFPQKRPLGWLESEINTFIDAQKNMSADAAYQIPE